MGDLTITITRADALDRLTRAAGYTGIVVAYHEMPDVTED